MLFRVVAVEIFTPPFYPFVYSMSSVLVATVYVQVGKFRNLKTNFKYFCKMIKSFIVGIAVSTDEQ
jgi:hypothetical protein